MPSTILVIDDEDSMCSFMEIMLSKEGYKVSTTNSAREGVAKLRDKNFDLVIADLHMPEMNGIQVLKEIKTFKANQEILVMTAYASVDTAIEAMKLGASDYLTKPFNIEEIKLIIEKSIGRHKLIVENSNLKRQLLEGNSFDKFIGTSEVVIKLKKLAERVASSDATVLILGESGTGKDVIARAIHSQSPRHDGPFITINCAALPESLLESELFGHKRGAFTGAVKDKEGLFQVASGGTFFLDEIGNTSLTIQAKLLRVLEDKKIMPVGGTEPVDVDVRVLAATNSNLEEDVQSGLFRADLFYRLNVIPVHIPPLRERQTDIPLLIQYFIELNCRKMDVPMKDITDRAITLLSEFPWPGNVRELENTLERAVLLNRSDTLDISDFPDRLSQGVRVSPVSDKDPETPTLEAIEKAYIHFVMSQTAGNKREAARILAIDASTLYRKLDRYKLKSESAE